VGASRDARMVVWVSVVDPRSGEIIKGHVTLGSLRVRQDYLIAEGCWLPTKKQICVAEMQGWRWRGCGNWRRMKWDTRWD